MDSNKNKYYTIYDKSEVIFQDKFKETILTTQSYIELAKVLLTRRWIMCTMLAAGLEKQKIKNNGRKERGFHHNSNT